MRVPHTGSDWWQRQEVMGVPHTASADKERKRWENHTQAVLTKKGRNWLDHHAEADQWIESHFVQTRDVLTGVVFRHTDESDLFKIVMCLYPSRLQTQSVECEQLKPGVYWSRSSSDTVSGMWTVETRCILVQVVFWQSMESHQFKAGARTLSGHRRHSHWSLSHRTKRRLDSAAPRPSRPIHRRSTGAWVSENKRGKKEEKKKKTSLVYRGIRVYMDNTCLQRHNGLHGQYVSTET